MKYGKWIKEYKEDAPLFMKDRWRCSACNDVQFDSSSYKFCPNCGANMQDDEPAEGTLTVEEYHKLCYCIGRLSAIDHKIRKDEMSDVYWEVVDGKDINIEDAAWIKRARQFLEWYRDIAEVTEDEEE